MSIADVLRLRKARAISARLDTLGELDRFREVLAGNVPCVSTTEMLQWLEKIRAHVVADELERKRLQGIIMGEARVLGHEEKIFDTSTVRRVLELEAGWELAPQRARLAARMMGPAPVCGAAVGGEGRACLRGKGHAGECCPRERCEVDHGKGGG